MAIPRVSCLGRYCTGVHSYLGVCFVLVVVVVVVGGGGFSHGVPNSRGGGLGLIVFCVFQRVAMWEVKVVVDWVWL